MTGLRNCSNKKPIIIIGDIFFFFLSIGASIKSKFQFMLDLVEEETKPNKNN